MTADGTAVPGRFRAADLLAGPRGRRFLLELALGDGASQDAVDAVFWASHHRDANSHLVHLRDGSPTSALAPPEPTPEDVGRALLGSPLPDPSLPRLLDALDASVASALPWQDPDGTDALLAEPAMVPALRRIARHVLPVLPSWWSGDDTLSEVTQVIVRRVEGSASRDSPGSPSTAREVLTRWRHDEVKWENHARREHHHRGAAGVSGRWWSIPPHELTRTSRWLPDIGPLGLRFQEDDPGQDTATTTSNCLPVGARILTVDAPEDWAALCRRAGLDVSVSRGPDWARSTGGHGPWVLPDWQAVAETFDAVHVTVRGYLTSASTVIAVDEHRASALAGFSPDELVLCGAIDPAPVPGGAQRWRRDGGHWQRDGENAT